MRLEAITREQAARAYACAVHPGLDPDGIATPDAIAGAGQSFRLTGPRGQVAYTVGIVQRELWVYAAAGTGQGMTLATLRTLEAQAARNGCDSVGFQTVRRGLIRYAKRAGFGVEKHPVRGYIMRKTKQ